jgi:hypothetical protein
MPRLRIADSTTECARPAEDVYQTCGFSATVIVGAKASISASVRSYASSKIRQSVEDRPRPALGPRAMNHSFWPDTNSIDFSTGEFKILRTRRFKSA